MHFVNINSNFGDNKGWGTAYGTMMNINIIIIKIESAVQGQERVRILYQSKDPNRTQPTNGRKKKRIRRRQKERADYANRKALALLLKPVSPTPSNTGQPRSFQRDTERSTKVVLY